MLVAAVMFALARFAKDEAVGTKEAAASTAAKPDAKTAPAGDPMDAALKLDDLTLEVGFGLVPLADAKQGGQLLNKVRALRKHLARELGFLVPPIHITDNLSLREHEYVISLRGVEIARWEMQRDCLLAISSNIAAAALPGQDTREPAFNVPAKWIARESEPKALSAGYTVVDNVTALTTHLGEVIRQNAHELLTRSETKRLVDRLNDSHPKLIEELIPKLMTLGEVQKILQQLLREQVSIRDLGTILESMVETAPISKNPVMLVEAARHAVGRALVRPLLNERGELRVVTLDNTIEEECARALNGNANAPGAAALQPSLVRRVLEGLRNLLGEHAVQANPVLLCASPGRFYLRRLLEPFLPKLVVLAPTEIPAAVPVHSVGMLR
jgi:flagellar biosynthesis protein FlhA